MPSQHVRLKDALRARHWQTYRTFCREYDRAAKTVDPGLVGTWPSRAQLHRWLSGDLKGLPYPDHCRVLEKMLSDWTVEQLFEICGPGCPQEATSDSDASFTTGIVRSVTHGLANPGASRANWGSLATTDASTIVIHRPRQNPNDDGSAPLPELITQKLLALGHAKQIPPAEVEQLSGLAGNLIDLNTEIELNIEPDGACSVTYRYHLLNLTDHPVARMSRDLWFQHSRGPLTLDALQNDGTKLAVQRLHAADNMVKFALHLSPPVQPGDDAAFGYRCSGAEFRQDLYWRQALARYTRRFGLIVRHQGIGQLAGLTAIEELPDGTEQLAQQSLTWDYDGEDAVMKLTLDYLRPNQYATLRWEKA